MFFFFFFFVMRFLQMCNLFAFLSCSKLGTGVIFFVRLVGKNIEIGCCCIYRDHNTDTRAHQRHYHGAILLAITQWRRRTCGKKSVLEVAISDVAIKIDPCGSCRGATYRTGNTAFGCRISCAPQNETRGPQRTEYFDRYLENPI